MQWELEQAAYDLPPGRMSAERQLEMAQSLEALGALYRSHAAATARKRREIDAGDAGSR